MKHLYCLAKTFVSASMLLLIFSSSVNAQCTGFISLSTQSEINSFACTNIEGTLYIEDDNDGIDNIVSLDPIYLNGLNNGAIVTEDVIVVNCNSLTDLLGLDGIFTIEGDFIVNNCPNLQFSSVFFDLSSIQGSLIHRNNPGYNVVNAYQNLVNVDNNFEITDNGAIGSPDLPSLEVIGGQLLLEENDDLESTVGFSALQEAGIKIAFNESMEMVLFENLFTAGALELVGLPNVSEPSFPSLLNTGGGILYISGLESMTTLSAFPNLEEIGWWMQIADNANLEVIDDFPNLISIGNEFNILGNFSLESVIGFSNIESVGGSFNVLDNPNLNDCCWAIPTINTPPTEVNIGGNGPNGCDIMIGIGGLPMLPCIGGFATPNNPGDCAGDVTNIDPTPFNNCGDLESYESYTLTLEDANGVLVYDQVTAIPGLEETLTLPVGINTYTYILIDDFGNEAVCEFTVLVEDVEAPTWDLGTNTLTVIGECGVDDLGDLFNANTPTATDNCTDMVNYAAIGPIDEFICTSGAAMQHTYTFFASDEVGNEAESFFLTIRLEDTTPPEILGVGDDETIYCDDFFPDIPDPLVLDVCDGDITDNMTAISSVSMGPCGLGEIAEIHEYVWNVADGCGNTAQETWTVTIISDFEFDLGDDIVECNDSEYTIDPDVDGVFYNWSTGDDDESLTVDESGEYSVTITTENGCCFSDMINVTFGEALDITTEGATLDCTGNAVQIFATADAMGATYTWSGPGGFMSSDQNPMVSEAGEYTVSVMDANGCTTTATATVDANTDAPDISATGGTLTCSASSVTLMGSSMAAGATFSWVGPDGFTSDEANPTVSVAGIYTLTVSATNGCISTLSVTVDQDIVEPTVNIMEGSIDCETSTVSLTGSGEMGASGFSWVGPNGFSSMDLTVNVSDSGTYTFSAVGENGCTGSLDFELVESIAYSETITTTDIDNDNDTGTATINIEGGVMPFNIFWDNGDSGMMATGLTAGIHTVTVVDGIPCSKVYEFEILDNTSSTNNIALSRTTKVYPNPVQDIVTVKFSEKQLIKSFQVLDMNGKLISTEVINRYDNEVSIKASEWESGVYILNILLKDDQYSTSVVKL